MLRMYVELNIKLKTCVLTALQSLQLKKSRIEIDLRILVIAPSNPPFSKSIISLNWFVTYQNQKTKHSSLKTMNSMLSASE